MSHPAGKALLMAATVLALVVAPAVPAQCLCGESHGRAGSQHVASLPSCCADEHESSCGAAGTEDACGHGCTGAQPEGGPCRRPDCPCRHRPPLVSSLTGTLGASMLSLGTTPTTFLAPWASWGRPGVPIPASAAVRQGAFPVERPPGSLGRLATQVLLI